jgi:hypothetical protein
MNRFLVALAITTLAITGCAADVNDPLPQPPTPQEPQPKPPTPLDGKLNDPYDQVRTPLHIGLPPDEMPLLEKPPLPTN